MIILPLLPHGSTKYASNPFVSFALPYSTYTITCLACLPHVHFFVRSI